MRNKLLSIVTTLLMVFSLACPQSTQHKAAEAAQNASIIVQTYQTTEIQLHSQGIISDGDHKVIERELLSVAQMGIALDSCIRAASSQNAVSNCAGTAVTTLNTIASDGRLGIHSPQAVQDFQLAMTGITSAIQIIEVVTAK